MVEKIRKDMTAGVMKNLTLLNAICYSAAALSEIGHQIGRLQIELAEDCLDFIRGMERSLLIKK
ncbi:MAG: hypothetical protein PHF50_04010 [Patescibacteria group bacterium]|nr:hypothetical protein [Patescibacteria group bacterium]